MNYQDAIAALADPSRRAIVDRLRGGPLPVSVIAKGLTISRPAVSQHLRVLSDAGLLTVTAAGNRRLYRLSPDGLSSLRNYLDSLWDDALTAFQKEADTRRSDRKLPK